MNEKFRLTCSQRLVIHGTYLISGLTDLIDLFWLPIIVVEWVHGSLWLKVAITDGNKFRNSRTLLLCLSDYTYALWILFRRCVIQNIKAIKFLVLVIATEF